MPSPKLGEFITLARQAASRELHEEVKFPWAPDSVEEDELLTLIDTAPYKAYYSIDGVSNCRHMEIIFDCFIEDGSMLGDYFTGKKRGIISNERAKHTVELLTYDDLITGMGSTDELGAFVVSHMQSARWWEEFLEDTNISNDLFDAIRDEVADEEAAEAASEDTSWTKTPE